jgi:hypothetical protein
MVLIKGKVFKVGTSYGLRIRKALIDAEIINCGDEIIAELKSTKAPFSCALTYTPFSALLAAVRTAGVSA